MKKEISSFLSNIRKCLLEAKRITMALYYFVFTVFAVIWITDQEWNTCIVSSLSTLYYGHLLLSVHNGFLCGCVSPWSFHFALFVVGRLAPIYSFELSVVGRNMRRAANKIIAICKPSVVLNKTAERGRVVLQIVCRIAPFETLNYNIGPPHAGVWLKLHVYLAPGLFYIPLCATENKEFSCGVSRIAASKS